MKLVTAEQMRELDRSAIRERGITGMQLMERAGRAVALCAGELIEKKRMRRSALIFAGKGNNGGDAFVAARYLEGAGVRTRTILLGDRKEFKSDALENLKRLERSGAEIVSAATLGELEEAGETAPRFDLVIDGILGTGVKGNVSGYPAEAIFYIGGLYSTVVSIDVPSGLDATSGRVCGVAVRASVTVAMGLPKIGLVAGDGMEHSGRILVADIGLPEQLKATLPSSGELVVEQDLYGLFAPRRKVSHKGDYGRLLVVAGSRGMTGAACLVASAALRSGAGLVTVAIPRSLNPILEMKLTEAITLPLPETAEGSLSGKAGERILEMAEDFDAMVVGPGLSRNGETLEMIRALVSRFPRPMVIDADALTALAAAPETLKNASAPVILTPHPGEMARLLNCSIQSLMGERLEIARDFAVSSGVTLVLKGAGTVVAGPGGEVSINASGNPGMATGGSGDVLSGVIGAFCMQGMSPEDAARSGVFVHGDAGDSAAAAKGERGMIASDIVDCLPGAMERLVHRGW